jgi:prepilin signal peptidase PulO-like enzyme (type II secretory pathway)
MNIFLYTFLFIFWTMFWSFASVLIYRIKSQEGWIVGWRSHCKTCERNLSAIELIPVLSWLFQGGKCRWCKQKISGIYPILEITTGILFMLVWIFLINSELIFSGNILEWARMIFFSSIMFLTVIYVFYDILYLEIPESILLSANILVFTALIAQWLGYSIIPYLPVWNLDITTLLLGIWILWALYYVMVAGLKEIYDCLIVTACVLVLAAYIYYYQVPVSSSALLTWTVAALWIFISFFLQIIVSWGRAMWAGDLRIAILMWLLVWVNLAFPAWMICYLIWSLVWILLIIRFKITSGLKSSFNHQIPFGPFIASWYLVVLFFAPQIQSLLQWYL